MPLPTVRCSAAVGIRSPPSPFPRQPILIATRTMLKPESTAESQPFNKRTSAIHKQANEQTNKQTNERTNKQTNKTILTPGYRITMSPVVAASVPHQDPPSYSMLFSPVASSLASADESASRRDGSPLGPQPDPIVGIPADNKPSQPPPQPPPQNLLLTAQPEWFQVTERDWYAKSLMDPGEYFCTPAPP